MSADDNTSREPRPGEPLEKFQYYALSYQDFIPLGSPADLHLTLEALVETMNRWGNDGWEFPESGIVKDRAASGPVEFGYRLRGLSPDSKGLVARRRISVK